MPRAGFEPATGPVSIRGPSARYQMFTIFSRVLSLASSVSEEQAELSRVLFKQANLGVPRQSPVELKAAHKTLGEKF